MFVGVYFEVKFFVFYIKEGVDVSKIVVDVLNVYGFGGESGNSYL